MSVFNILKILKIFQSFSSIQNQNIKKTAAKKNRPTTKGNMAIDCNICMESRESDVKVATECGHVFHDKCVSPWIQQNATCPTCRKSATIGSLRKIFVSVSCYSNSP